jgi:hypothetical protein
MDLLGSLVGLSNPFDKTSFNDALRRQVPVRPEAGQGCSAVVCRASADASSGSQAAARCAVWARYVAARLCGILPGHKVLGLIWFDSIRFSKKVDLEWEAYNLQLFRWNFDGEQVGPARLTQTDISVLKPLQHFSASHKMLCALAPTDCYWHHLCAPVPHR